MAKVISYKFISGERNTGTEQAPEYDPIILTKEMVCPTQAAYDANYPIAEKEAIAGTIEVTGEFDPEPVPAPDETSVWDELDAAYQEGVDSV